MKVAKWSWVLVPLTLVYGLGCNDTPKNAVCRAKTPPSYHQSGHVSPRDWIAVLHSDETDEKDCTGRWVELDQLPERCPSPAESARWKPNRSATNDVVVRQHGDGFVLVWTPTQRFDNGDLGGPVALVHLGESDFSVMAIGVLRLPPGQVKLEIVDMQGETLLLAEGTNCLSVESVDPCARIMTAMILDQGRWRSIELRDQGQRCIGAASVSLERVDLKKLQSGWTRRFVLTSPYELLPNGVLLREQLVVTDVPSSGDMAQGEVFRRAQGRRMLEFMGAYFVENAGSVWARMRPSDADLD